MPPQAQNDGAGATAMFPSPRRLVVLAVLLPAAVAAVNHALFELYRFSEVARPSICAALVVTTAVLSSCVGRYLYPSWLRWVIFAWCLTLLDLLAFAGFGGTQQPFVLVLISAQLNLVILWTILADVGWQTRLPGTAAAIAILIIVVKRWQYYNLTVLVYLAALVVLLVCFALRWKGYLLRRSGDLADDLNHVRHNNLVKSNQFGIKHMLLWATALAPLLIVAPTFDCLVITRVGTNTQSLFPALAISISLAIVALTSIWAVLGAGVWPVRIAAIVLVPLLLSVGLEAYSAFIRPKLPTVWRWSFLYVLCDLERQWSTWLWLNAAMLAALLLFVRANGYVLARKYAGLPTLAQ